MNYIVTELLTTEHGTEFYILGQSEDKKRAAQIAIEIYKAYNKVASFQNIEMITEWLETRKSYSFRKDKQNRLQLAITEIDGETLPKEKQLIYSASKEEDELMRKVSQALFEGKHTASRGEVPTCRAEMPQ